MDRNTVIGFVLIFGLLIAMQLVIGPEQKKMKEAAEHRLDSLRQIERLRADSLAQLETLPTSASGDTAKIDSNAIAKLAGQYGAFAQGAVGIEKEEVIENEVMRIIFTNKGGRIKEVELKKHFKVHLDSLHKTVKLPLKLLEDEKNKFEYLIPMAGVPSGLVSTDNLFFQATKKGEKSIAFTSTGANGALFEQTYSLDSPDGYGVSYDVRHNGLNATTPIKLNWVDYLDRLEQNYQYEVNYSTVYFKPADDDYDYCSCTKDDALDKSNEKLKWIAHSNQFFASVLMAKNSPFAGSTMSTEKVTDPKSSDLKIIRSQLSLPVESQSFAMQMYLGPKDFETLRSYGAELEDIVPFGRSIMGTFNRWIIRPLFNGLMGLVGSQGIVILLLTFIVKLLLYPLTYKMLHSQAKMTALKPKLTGIREKFKDDQTQLQMETMKIYREFGVNPLGGCFPIALQMPVWLALYRFFPASIEFRQAGFLWATDLSSFDVAFWLPFEIPFYGAHVSLFTLLWVITTIMYTYYNMQNMDMGSMGGANAKMMKWMQYLMPVFFLFFFNNFASGLTLYLVFSNILNITQTLVTKNWIINHEKISEQLEANRNKPKKKGGFQSRLEEAMKQQQAIAAQRDSASKKKK